MFSNLRISAKLSLLIGIMVLAMAAIGGYAAYALREAQADTATALQRARDLLQADDDVRTAEVNFRMQVQEWKDLLLRGHDPADHDHYLQAVRQRSEAVVKHFGQARKSLAKVGIASADLEDAARLHRDLTQAYLDALQKFEVARPDTTGEVDRLVRGKDRPMEEKMAHVVQAVTAFRQAESARVAEASARSAQAALVLLSTLLAAVVLAAIVIGKLVAVSISRPIQHAAQAARRVAQGDLTAEVAAAHARDEAGQLLEAIGQMTLNLRQLVTELAERAHTVADTSSQIAQGNLDLSQRTEEQASTLEETASQMEELTTTVTQNADNARNATQLARGASEVARKGGQVVGQVVSTMTGISDSSKKIAEIIGVIDGIAFQTNILALNAAVEAARAGEQGRGFAVVAAEVRNLAQRSAAAAREIKELISGSVGQVQEGTRLVDAAGSTMQDIVDSVNQVSELIAEIAAASQEQSAGIEQVNTAITQMDQVVQQNASLVEEATAATASMKEQASLLLQSVGRFELGSAASIRTRHEPQLRAAPSAAIARVRVRAAAPALPRARASGEWQSF